MFQAIVRCFGIAQFDEQSRQFYSHIYTLGDGGNEIQTSGGNDELLELITGLW